MKELAHHASNYFIYAVAVLLLSALQTSLWLQLFGWFPPPQIWLTTLVFWVLYRALWEGVIMVYILTIVVSPFTAQPLSHLLLVTMLTFAALFFSKRTSSL